MSDQTVSNKYEWGGDGSNPSRPVADHVRAALVPSDGSYPPPVDKLLKLGSPHNYKTFNAAVAPIELTEAHIPDLIRLARDRDLNTRSEDTPEIWAPIHAVLALARFDIGPYIADLLPLFDTEGEWFSEELPPILAKAGAPAIEPLRQYIQDTSRWLYGRWSAIRALSEVGQQHPELRDQVVALLSDTLASERIPDVSAAIISALITLKAAEALPAIRAAFERDAVDEEIVGNWPEVLEALGQPIDADDPLVQTARARKPVRLFGDQPGQIFSRAAEPFPKATAIQPARPSNRKNKRKMAAASRKANKKKRK